VEGEFATELASVDEGDGVIPSAYLLSSQPLSLL
jgi:hypothetical protein